MADAKSIPTARPNAGPGVLSVRYELAGTVNGAQVSLHGRGSFEARAGRAEIGFETLSTAALWDPVLIVPTWLDVLILALDAGLADETSEPNGSGLPLFAETVVSLHDDAGRRVGQATVSTVASVEDGVLAVRSQFLDAACSFEPLELMNEIEAPFTGALIRLCDDRSLLTTAWTCSTNRGHTYLAASTSRSWERKREAGPALSGVVVRSLAVKRAGLTEVTVAAGFELDP